MWDDDVQQVSCNWMSEVFGPLPNGMIYIREPYLDVVPIVFKDLRGLMLHGKTELSILVGYDRVEPYEMLWIMPYGSSHRATIETCGINRADLLALGAALSAEPQPAPASEPEACAANYTAKAANNWDEHNLQRLLSESREPGATHKKLAEQYKVSRQRIAKLLNDAKPKRASPFDSLKSCNNKK
jgi:hypothetical protein